MIVSPYDAPGNHASGIEAPLTNVCSAYAPQKGVHFYHFSMSFYSQLARLALEEKRVAWKSHPVLLVAYEQYDPSYVRINPRCVVPTLAVDGRVTTDAFNICRFVDSHFDGDPLIPEIAEERECIEKFSSIFKGIFVEALTYGIVSDFKGPLIFRLFGAKNHHAKAATLKNLMERYKDDSFLKEAYEKKLAVLTFTEESMQSEDDMQALMATIHAAMDALEQQLRVGPFTKGGWLCSWTYSQADIEWSVMLKRFDFLNLANKLLATRPLTAQYRKALFARPAFKRGIMHWEHPLTQILLPVLRKKIAHHAAAEALRPSPAR